MNKIKINSLIFMLTWSATSLAAPNNTQLAVWANEAIVATYSYNYQNFMERQRDIAKYFTADGWTAYSTALNASGLPQAVAKNDYYVSAVATLPPVIKNTGDNKWHATMPLLVIYKNPQYQQKQTLLIDLDFTVAPEGQGIRGLSIISLNSKVTEAPCVCQPATSDKQLPPPGATQSGTATGQ